MGDHRVESYKRSVQSITKKWGAQIEKLGKELGEVDSELAELKALEEPSEVDEARMEELRKQRTALQKKIDNCVMQLSTNLKVLKPPEGAPKKELQELPKWLKSMIEDEGIPLGGGLSVAPVIEVDVKAKSLEAIGVNITIRW